MTKLAPTPFGRPDPFWPSLFVIISCYDGGFATLPAYVGDLFGTKQLAIIYGYLLTAWSAAGVVGPMFAAAARAKSGGFIGTLHYGAIGFAVALVLALLIRLDTKTSHMRPRIENKKEDTDRPGW